MTFEAIPPPELLAANITDFLSSCFYDRLPGRTTGKVRDEVFYLFCIRYARIGAIVAESDDPDPEKHK